MRTLDAQKGDFNMEPATLEKYLETMTPKPQLSAKHRRHSSDRTPTRQKEPDILPRNVDHICMTNWTPLEPSKIHKDCDISDHLPVSVSLPIISIPAPTSNQEEDKEWKTIRITSKIKERQELKEPIANHNYWQILAETKDEEDDPDSLATLTSKTMHKIADEMNLRPTKRVTPRPSKLPKVLCRAIMTRRTAWKEYRRTDPEQDPIKFMDRREDWSRKKRKVTSRSRILWGGA